MTRPLPTFRDLRTLARVARTGDRPAIQAELDRWPPLRRYRRLVAWMALRGGHTELFLEGLADFPRSQQRRLRNRALCWAARFGTLDQAKALLAAGANPQTSDSLPLAKAAHRGHADLVGLLLALSRPSTECLRPLRWSIWAGHAELALLLAQHTPLSNRYYTAIEMAANAKHMTVLKVLLDQWSTLPVLPKQAEHGTSDPKIILNVAFVVALAEGWAEGAETIQETALAAASAPFRAWVGDDSLALIGAAPDEACWTLMWQAIQRGDPDQFLTIKQHYQLLEGCLQGNHPTRVAAILARLATLPHQPNHPALASFKGALPSDYPNHHFFDWTEHNQIGATFPPPAPDQPPTPNALACVCATLMAHSGQQAGLDTLLENTSQAQPDQVPSLLSHALFGAMGGGQVGLAHTLLDRWLALRPSLDMALWLPYLLHAIRPQQRDLFQRLQAYAGWPQDDEHRWPLVRLILEQGQIDLLEAWGSAWCSSGLRDTSSVRLSDELVEHAFKVPAEHQQAVLDRLALDLTQHQRERLLSMALSRRDPQRMLALLNALLHPHDGILAARVLQTAVTITGYEATVVPTLMAHTDWEFDDGLALSQAAERGNVAYVALLLPHGEPPAHAGRALLRAVDRRSSTCVALLLPSSAKAWREAAQRATQHGDAASLALILDHAPEERDACWALAVAQSSLQEDVLGVLDARGANPAAHHSRLVARAALLVVDELAHGVSEVTRVGRRLLARFAPRSNLLQAQAWMEGTGTWTHENLDAMDLLAPWADEATLLAWLEGRADDVLPSCRAQLRHLRLAQVPATPSRSRQRA